jgi:hypothetical protein
MVSGPGECIGDPEQGIRPPVGVGDGAGDVSGLLVVSGPGEYFDRPEQDVCLPARVGDRPGDAGGVLMVSGLGEYLGAALLGEPGLAEPVAWSASKYKVDTS